MVFYPRVCHFWACGNWWIAEKRSAIDGKEGGTEQHAKNSTKLLPWIVWMWTDEQFAIA
jgi:hypothetical protein